MTDRQRRARTWVLLSACLCAALSCAKTNQPGASRETNWLTLCDADAQCVDSQCVCGLCSRACSGSAQCGDAVRCQPSGSTLVGTACGPAPEVPGLCAPECGGDGDCAGGQSCVEGACAPLSQLDAGMLGSDAAL